MVGILLDRETRTQLECERLSATSNGVLKFLDETMLENYVLHAGAIASVLMQHGESVEESAVDDYLKEIVNTATKGGRDGAKILSLAFYKFTETRTEFKKTRDVPALITWLLQEDIAFLQPLGNVLRGLFGLTSSA